MRTRPFGLSRRNRMSSRLVASIVLLAFSTAACGPEIVPPPAVPQKVVPQVAGEPGPPAQGEGRLVVDSASGPAQVEVIVNRSTSYASVGGYVGAIGMVTSSHLCVSTPCAVNLPYGQYELFFQSKSDEDRFSSDTATVGQKPSIFRHELGSRDQSTTALAIGSTSITLGSLGLLTGGSLLIAGLATEGGNDAKTSTDFKSIGAVTVGISAAVLALGIGLLIAGRPKVQAGSSVQWSPDGAVPTAPAPSTENVGTKL
jgi:hypothetical protein